LVNLRSKMFYLEGAEMNRSKSALAH
jgi:hypothetical protein